MFNNICRKRNNSKNALTVLLLFFISCKSFEKYSAEPRDLTQEQLKESIDSLFNAYIEEDEPGAAILVAYDCQMVIGNGYGLRNLNTREPITKSTNMRMGSVSKQFTALTILKLVDEGKLSLHDSVYAYFPFETFSDGTTIEQLINHTSGKADAAYGLFEELDDAKVADNGDVLNWYASENRTIAKPGKEYRYNSGIYEFIPSIVEKITGEDFAAFAATNVFLKAGMQKTNYFSLAKPIEIEDKAICYEKSLFGNWRNVDDHFLNGLVGAGAVYSSVNDYFQYDLALRNKTLLSAKAHEIIFKPSSMEMKRGGNNYYAMGWIIKGRTASHTGDWFGTSTVVKRYLDQPLTIAIFMNRDASFRNDLLEKTEALVWDYLRSIENNRKEMVPK